MGQFCLELIAAFEVEHHRKWSRRRVLSLILFLIIVELVVLEQVLHWLVLFLIGWQLDLLDGEGGPGLWLLMLLQLIEVNCPHFFGVLLNDLLNVSGLFGTA